MTSGNFDTTLKFYTPNKKRSFSRQPYSTDRRSFMPLCLNLRGSHHPFLVQTVVFYLIYLACNTLSGTMWRVTLLRANLEQSCISDRSSWSHCLCDSVRSKRLCRHGRPQAETVQSIAWWNIWFRIQRRLEIPRWTGPFIRSVTKGPAQ